MISHITIPLYNKVTNVLCICTYMRLFVYNVVYSVGGTPQSIVLKIPLMVHKLSEPTEMISTDFFQRWKNLPR